MQSQSRLRRFTAGAGVIAVLASSCAGTPSEVPSNERAEPATAVSETGNAAPATPTPDSAPTPKADAETAPASPTPTEVEIELVGEEAEAPSEAVVVADDDCAPLVEEAQRFLAPILETYIELGADAFNDFERFQVHAMELDALSEPGCEEEDGDRAIVRLAIAMAEGPDDLGMLSEDVHYEAYVASVAFAVSDLCAEGHDCNAPIFVPAPPPPKPVVLHVEPIECAQNGGQVYARVHARTNHGVASANVAVHVRAGYQTAGVVHIPVHANSFGREFNGTGITSASGIGAVVACEVRVSFVRTY